MTTKLPPCPKCGSANVVKNGGIRMLCKDCGRQSNRFNIPRTGVVDQKRPRCPRCGSNHVWKHGNVGYVCAKCGRSFTTTIGGVE